MRVLLGEKNGEEYVNWNRKESKLTMHRGRGKVGAMVEILTGEAELGVPKGRGGRRREICSRELGNEMKRSLHLINLTSMN